MAEINYGYISATFPEETVQYFRKVTSLICKTDDFYVSKEVGYINGDVSGSLHMTLFYGLSSNVDGDEVSRIASSLNIDTLVLGSVALRTNRNWPYKLLWIPILDVNGELKAAAELFKRFPHESSVQLDFFPHLSLAYVKQDFELTIVPVIPQTLKIKEFLYFKE